MSKSISPCVLEGPVVAECAHQEWTTGLTALPQRPYWFPFPPYSVMPFGVKRSRPAHLSYAPDTVTIQSHLHLQPPRLPLILTPKQVKFKHTLLGKRRSSALTRLVLTDVIGSMTSGNRAVFYPPAYVLHVVGRLLRS